jgi:glycosyltransferase involved in cell wall biosynthesis
MEVHRPRVVVDVAPRAGLSYVTFGEALRRLTIDGRVFSVASSPGDRESIDLLHVAGLQLETPDFEEWRSRLSRRAVVLVHGTATTLWDEVREGNPHFEFLDGEGLGVAGLGMEIGPALRALFAADPALTAQIRGAYARLGAGQSAAEPEPDGRVRELEQAIEARTAENSLLRERILELASARRELEARVAHLKAELRTMRASAWWRLGRPLRAGTRRAASALPASRPRAKTGVASTARSASSRPRIVLLSGKPVTAGHRYRVLNMASALSTHSFETVVLAVDEAAENMAVVDAADVVWIWRAGLSGVVADAFERARRVGAKIVFDVDDLVFRPELARAEIIDGIRTNRLEAEKTKQAYERMQRSLLTSDHATTTTEALARHMRELGKPVTVIPNGFDLQALEVAAKARAERVGGDGVIRIGYASGSFTHQRDFAAAAPALARVLAEHAGVRLVLFRPKVDLSEFPELGRVDSQIEWRSLVPLDELPREYARFDINIAPLEIGNLFCEAKSELKFVEAALVGVPTVASPTRPLADAIRDGETGFLADGDADWHSKLSQLVLDPELRRRMADAAYPEVLSRFGPERRGTLVTQLVEELLDPGSSMPERLRDPSDVPA